jgi:hypothetical protein
MPARQRRTRHLATLASPLETATPKSLGTSSAAARASAGTPATSVALRVAGAAHLLGDGNFQAVKLLGDNHPY